MSCGSPAPGRCSVSIPEIGWALAAWSHGNGYATEAALAAIRWADASLAHPETVCLIDPDNAASLRVAAKTGYAPTGRGRLGTRGDHHPEAIAGTLIRCHPILG